MFRSRSGSGTGQVQEHVRFRNRSGSGAGQVQEQVRFRSRLYLSTDRQIVKRRDPVRPTLAMGSIQETVLGKTSTQPLCRLTAR